MLWILGIICLGIGLIVGIGDAKIWMNAQEWFIAAVACGVLGDGLLPPLRRRSE